MLLHRGVFPPSRLDLPEGASTFLIDGPRWLFLAILVYAPWAYGCTPRPAWEALEILLFAASSLWFLGWTVRDDRPAIHPVSVALAYLLLLQGWFMAANARFHHDMEKHAFNPVTPLLSWAPGTVDAEASITTMLRITALLMAFFVASDMAARPRWRQRIWWTAGLTGLSIILLGLLQKATDAQMIFWEYRNTTSQFFATYYYHGNAGSYINLVFPLVAGLAVLFICDRNAHARRALWIATAFLFMAAAAVNFSRSGQVITFLLLIVWLFVAANELRTPGLLPGRALTVAYVGIAAAALAGLIIFSGWQRAFEKWKILQEQVNGENPRLLALRAIRRMIPDAGWWGFGPGTFELAFPHYTQSLNRAIAGIWRYAHNDYLQTILEWGWIGAALWAVFIFGGLAKCFAARGLPRADRLLLIGAGLALTGAAVHALIEFPFQIASLQLYIVTYLAMGWGSGKWLIRQKET